MKKNMGFADRVIRLLVAIFLADVAIKSVVQDVWLVVVWIFIGVLVATTLTARCPLYSLLHIHTNKADETNIKPKRHE